MGTITPLARSLVTCPVGQYRIPFGPFVPRFLPLTRRFVLPPLFPGSGQFFPLPSTLVLLPSFINRARRLPLSHFLPLCCLRKKRKEKKRLRKEEKVRKRKRGKKGCVAVPFSRMESWLESRRRAWTLLADPCLLVLLNCALPQCCCAVLLVLLLIVLNWNQIGYSRGTLVLFGCCWCLFLRYPFFFSWPLFSLSSLFYTGTPLTGTSPTCCDLLLCWPLLCWSHLVQRYLASVMYWRVLPSAVSELRVISSLHSDRTLLVSSVNQILNDFCPIKCLINSCMYLTSGTTYL